jgi:hypothetical protein
LGSMETQRRIQKLFNLLNDLLIHVMRGSMQTDSSLFIEKVLQIARAYDPDDTAYDNWGRPEWGEFLVSLFENSGQRETVIETFARSITIKELKRKNEYEKYKAYIETGWTRYEVNRSIAKYVNLVEAVRDLCIELQKSPITISTGERKMVKRIQPHITYITHESEKITHPRKTISHPQRTYADMHNEVASQLTNLDNFVARVRYKNADGRLVECTIRTLDPKQQPKKPLFGQALQARLGNIKEQNKKDGYLRERVAVEEEIRQRQEQCNQPPEQEPPIYRRKP